MRSVIFSGCVVLLGLSVVVQAQSRTPRIIVGEEEEALQIPGDDIALRRPERRGQVERPPIQGGVSVAIRLRQLAEEAVRSGLHDEAAAMHQLAERIEHRTREVVAAKERQLEELEQAARRVRDELSVLRGATARGPTAQVRVQLLEMPAEMVDMLDVDWSAESMTGGASRPNEPKAGTKRKAFDGTVPVRGIAAGRELERQLDRLVARGQVKRLAQPSLVTPSGRSGKFHSGGEFPVLVPQGDEPATIQFRPFGQRLEVTPEWIGDGTWRLDIGLEVSERDFSNSVTNGAGSVAPGLTSRNIATRVEMHEGDQALVLNLPGLKRVAKPTSGKGKPTGEVAQEELQLVTVVTVNTVDEPVGLEPQR